MAWARAVWNEVDKDGMGKVFQQSVPSNWIINKTLHWPNHFNVKRSFKNQEDPTSEWHKFKLIKVKETGQLSCWLDVLKVLFCIDKIVRLCSHLTLFYNHCIYNSNFKLNYFDLKFEQK